MGSASTGPGQGGMAGNSLERERGGWGVQMRMMAV